ncbi:MAG: TetR/AcrR family transcriptional regulator, partial [Spirochaetaceae bacterium]|nr:TetR/AcrR family transcriptional regulator [Spirochaetaceae bacterium]
MEQMSRVERKKQAARTRILDAAEELFLQEDGYTKTTIHEIAERADVSTGAVYMHFAGKPDIMAVLLDQIMTAHSHAFSGITEEGKSGLDRVETFIDRFFQTISQPRFLTYLHTIERLDPGEINPELVTALKEKGMRVYSILREAIAGGQDDGSIKKLDTPDIVAFILLHVIRSFIRDITTRNSLSEPLCHFPQFSGEMALRLLKEMILASIGGKPEND